MVVRQESEISFRRIGSRDNPRYEGQGFLASVVEKLKANKKLYFAGEPIFKPCKFAFGLHVENVSIIAAPINPIFEGGELSGFMDSLARRLKPSKLSNPYGQGDDGIGLGTLQFCERVGTTLTENRNTITVINPKALKGSRTPTKNTYGTIKTDLERTISVWVFPDILSAKIAFAYTSGTAKNQGDGPMGSNINIDSYPHFYITGKQINFLRKNQGMDLSKAIRMIEFLAEEERN